MKKNSRAEEFEADWRFYDKCEIRCPKCGDEGGMKGFMAGLKSLWKNTGYDDYESIYCPMCGKGVELVIPEGYNEYGDFIGDDDYEAEEFGGEDYDDDDYEQDGWVKSNTTFRTVCSKCRENEPQQDSRFCNECEKRMDAEGINLRKRIEDLIDLREINFTGFKKDTKREAVKSARRIENELKGDLPKGKSYKVDKPKWFKIAQTGIVLGVAGLVGYSGFKNKE